MFFVVPLLSPGRAFAAIRTWDGGCGANTSWSCAGNWSGDTVPAAGDTVTFNATSTGNSTVDAGFAGTVATLNVKAGYTGTIALARSLTVSATFSQAAGAFTAGSQALAVGAFKLSGGSFTASSGTTSIGRAMTVSGSPTFAANGGTVEFNGTAAATLSCDNVSFHLVRFTNTAGRKTVGGDCALPLGNEPTLGAAKGASVTLGGALSGTGTLTANQTFILNATAKLSGFGGLVANSGLTLNGASADFGSYAPFTVAGNYAQTGGAVSAPSGADFKGRLTVNAGSTFDAPSGTAAIGNNFTISSGATFNADGGTLTFDGGHTAVLSCGGKSLNLVTFTHDAGTKTVESNCTLPLGENPTLGTKSAAAVILHGALSGTGTLTAAGPLTLGGGSLSGFSGLDTGALTLSGGTYDFGAYAPFSVGGAFTLSSGAGFTAPAGTARFAGNFTDDGNFEAGVGTVELDGADQTLGGSTTFNNLSKSAKVGDKLTFEAGDTQTIEGALTLAGAKAGELLELVPSAPGTPWLIDAEGSQAVKWVSVSESESVGAIIPAYESVGVGSNPGWEFLP